jgi:hypothetical protein
MLPGTILAFLGASDLFLATRDASLGAVVRTKVGKPGPDPKAYPGSPIGPGLEARQVRAIR